MSKKQSFGSQRGHRDLSEIKPNQLEYGFLLQPSDEWISGRISLDPEELSLISDTVGLPPMQADIKAFLRQKCNIQNPEVLNFDDVLSHLRLYSKEHGGAEKTESQAGAGNRGNHISLKSFIAYYCNLSEKPDIQSKISLLHEYHRKNKIQLPELACPYRLGQHKLYFPDDLIRNWPLYCESMPTLPRLKNQK